MFKKTRGITETKSLEKYDVRTVKIIVLFETKFCIKH